MTIVDHQIRQLCRDMGLVEPYEPDMVNPASIDVTLGNKILIESEPIYRLGQRDQVFVDLPGNRWEEVDISDKPYRFSAGEFVLAHTAELIRVPNNLECVFNLKSSRGREGFEHLMAAYIDPGFHGSVTLELVNVNRHHSLTLKSGMRIGQLRFSKLDSIPMRNYSATGRYHLDKGPQPSKG